MNDAGLVLLVEPNSGEGAAPAKDVHAALGLTVADPAGETFEQTADGAYQLRTTADLLDAVRSILGHYSWHVVREMPRNEWEAPLWTAEQAAAYWRVSVSRARAILASRRIRHISGYPSSQIKHVELRQGARTDLAAQSTRANPGPAAPPAGRPPVG
jgi:hypothetical protein